MLYLSSLELRFQAGQIEAVIAHEFIPLTAGVPSGDCRVFGHLFRQHYNDCDSFSFLARHKFPGTIVNKQFILRLLAKLAGTFSLTSLFGEQETIA